MPPIAKPVRRLLVNLPSKFKRIIDPVQKRFGTFVVETRLTGPQAKIHIRVGKNTDTSGTAIFQLEGHGYRTTAEATFSGQSAKVDLDIPGAAVWSPATPNLYDLVVGLKQGGEVVDSYSLKIGVRTIRVE